MSEGGRYVIKDGKRVLVEVPTRGHPEGHAARTAAGELIDRPEAPRSAGKSAKPARATNSDQT